MNESASYAANRVSRKWALLFGDGPYLVQVPQVEIGKVNWKF